MTNRSSWRQQVREALVRPPVEYEAPLHAAVAAVMLPGPDLLFIRRAERDSDPWSGHVSFPGGRVDPSDSAPLHAAIRETKEEIGLDLTENELLGALDSVAPVAGLFPIAIHPFVFAASRKPDFEPNAEVASLHRVSLEELLANVGRGKMEFEWMNELRTVPRVDFDGVRLWGLTLRIVDDLLDRLDHRGVGLARLTV